MKRSATLVTGAAGFIGFFVAQQLLERGNRVIGLDNLNDYYDPELKRARLARLRQRWTSALPSPLLHCRTRLGVTPHITNNWKPKRGVRRATVPRGRYPI